jgi:Cdc25 family phosphatase
MYTYALNVTAGHISGATNTPVEEWDDDDAVECAVSTHMAEKISLVVFHCMYSQMRGPFCANR